MPEVISCGCGEVDYYLTPAGLMCEKCGKTLKFDDIKDVVKQYIETQDKLNKR